VITCCVENEIRNAASQTDMVLFVKGKPEGSIPCKSNFSSCRDLNQEACSNHQNLIVNFYNSN